MKEGFLVVRKHKLFYFITNNFRNKLIGFDSFLYKASFFEINLLNSNKMKLIIVSFFILLKRT